MACKLPLNRPLPKAIRNNATQVSVSNQVVFSLVARMGIDRMTYPNDMMIKPLMIVPL